MPRYSLFVRHELYDVIRRLPPVWRSKVIRFFESLETDPFQLGDYTERDPSDRSLQAKLFGPWTVVYWADHPVSEVKVVEILASDR